MLWSFWFIGSSSQTNLIKRLTCQVFQSIPDYETHQKHMGETGEPERMTQTQPCKEDLSQKPICFPWPFHDYNQRGPGHPTTSITAESRQGSLKMSLRQSHQGGENHQRQIPSAKCQIESPPLSSARVYSASSSERSAVGSVCSLCTAIAANKWESLSKGFTENDRVSVWGWEAGV